MCRDGDADLYISQYLSHPSYVLSEYCLHSASCGQDRIDIPSTFKRPIGVAVYGHILYPNSTYRLKVIVRDELEQVQEIGEDMILDSNVADPRKIAIPGVGNIEDSEVIHSKILFIILDNFISFYRVMIRVFSSFHHCFLHFWKYFWKFC